MGQHYSKSDGFTKSGKAKFKPDPEKYLYNIDTFYYNCRSHFYQEVMDNGLRDLLIAGRNFKADSEDYEDMTIELELPNYKNPVEFKILAGQAPAYQYSIRNDSMAIYFRKNEHDTGALMKVQINQFLLWEKGFEKAYNESLQVLKTLGFVPYECKINRLDFAVHSDQFIWTLDDLRKFNYPVNIAGDNFPGFHRLDPMTGAFETMYHGDRSRLYLRLYNKSKEIKANGKEYFNQIYEKMGMDKDNVWNFEIEVNRSYLKDLAEYDVETDEFIRIFDDVEYCIQNDGLSRLWSHLINKYGHNSAHWSVLKTGDPLKFNQINSYNLTIEKDYNARIEKELNQIAGRMMLGVVDAEDYSLDNAIRIFKELYLKQECEHDEDKSEVWLKKVEQKKSAIQNLEINRTIKKEAMRMQIYFENLKDELKEDKSINLHEDILQKNVIHYSSYVNKKNPNVDSPDFR